MPDNKPGQPVQQQTQGQTRDQQDENRIANLEGRMGRAEKIMAWLTGAIAFFALCSVGVGVLQWIAMNGSTTQSILTTKMQAQIWRSEYGAHINATPKWMGFYYEENRLYARVRVYNEKGVTGATAIQIAGKIDFNSMPNDSTDYNFSESDFKDTSPKQLVLGHDDKRLPFPGTKGQHSEYAESEHIVMNQPIFPEQEANYRGRIFYAWGLIRYKDLTNDWVPPLQFCRKIRVDAIFNKPGSGANGGGVSSAADCKDEPKPN